MSEAEAAERRYLDVEELAQYIRSTPASVRQLVHLKRVPYIKRGRRLLFDVIEVDRWLGAQRVEVEA